MKNGHQMYRQGDVLVIRVEELPDGLKPVKRDRDRIVLAYGEVTGHAHAIIDREAKLFEGEILEGELLADRFLQVIAKGGVDLVHEEHGTITLPPGDYVVRRQREYAPEALRNVAD